LAEGQPRNILDSNCNRFAGDCRVLSRRRHHVIHSCYAFWSDFSPNCHSPHRPRRARHA